MEREEGEGGNGHLIEEVIELCPKLHPSRASSHHHKVKQSPAFLLTDVGLGGQFQVHQYLVPDPASIRNFLQLMRRATSYISLSCTLHANLQEERVLLNSRDVEMIGRSPHPNDQRVVGHAVSLAWVQLAHTLDYTLLGVEARGLRLVVMVLVLQSGVSDRLDDAAKFQRAHCCAGHERCEEEMVARAYDDNVEMLLVHVSKETVATPTGSQYH